MDAQFRRDIHERQPARLDALRSLPLELIRKIPALLLLHRTLLPLARKPIMGVHLSGAGSVAACRGLMSGLTGDPRVRPTAVRFGFHSHASWACLGSFVGGGGGCVRAETGRRCRRLSETRAAKAEGRATAVCASWARRRISHAMRAVKI